MFELELQTSRFWKCVCALGLGKDGYLLEDSFGSRCGLSKGGISFKWGTLSVLGGGCKNLWHLLGA